MKGSIINKLIVGIGATLLVASAVGCDNAKKEKMIDYAHNGSCVLNNGEIDRYDLDFFQKGVGQFDLWMAIDGDTAHFTPRNTTTSSETVKARFYGIDTPESTGRVQEYGMKASNFTKEKLKNAAEHGTIVLAGVSSEYAVPGTDANGRYLCCVWINETEENAPIESLVNLNLWIMQEGLSSAGSVEKMPEYTQVFTDALMQAKRLKLNMYSGKPDPDFNYGDYITTDICDIMREAYKTMDEPGHENEYNNANVRITGTVTGYANNSLYIQKLDLDEGIYYGINCFCGMTKPNERYLVPGNVIEVCGIVKESENFGFQVTGLEGRFPNVPSLAKDTDCKILVKAANNTDPTTALHIFNETATTINARVEANDRGCVNSPVVISTELTVDYFQANQNGDKWTIGFDEANISVYLTEAFAGDPSKPNDTWTTEGQWIGRKMRIDFGIYVWHTTMSGNTRYQVLIQSAADFVCTNLSA